MEALKQFPNNKIIKKLFSSAWGEISKKKNIWKTEDDIINEKLDIGFGFENNYHIQETRATSTGDEYRLINLKTNIYEYQFRLKVFKQILAESKLQK
jgi:hypothetical protein